MANKREKIIYIDDEEYVWCSHEKEYLIHTEFDINKSDEYGLFCKKCRSLLYDKREINYLKGAQERNDYIKEKSKLMLENLGYDFNSEFTVHQQFLIKHKLI